MHELDAGPRVLLGQSARTTCPPMPALVPGKTVVGDFGAFKANSLQLKSGSSQQQKWPTVALPNQDSCPGHPPHKHPYSAVDFIPLEGKFTNI
jgi:hypothetical protein